MKNGVFLACQSELMINILHLENREKRTFRLHLIYMIIEGFVLGVLALNEFVFIKSLVGSNYQLAFLFQFSMLVFLFLVLANEFLKRVTNRKRLLRVVAIGSRLPLLLILVFPRDLDATLAQYWLIPISIMFTSFFFWSIFLVTWSSIQISITYLRLITNIKTLGNSTATPLLLTKLSCWL